MSSKVATGIKRNGLVVIANNGTEYYAKNVWSAEDVNYTVWSERGVEIMTDDLEKVANVMREVAPLTQWRFIKDGE